MNGYPGLPWFAFRPTFRFAPDDGATPATAQPEATPAAPPAPAGTSPSAEVPRDEKGRFTKANIERAAGVVPEPEAAPAAPAAAASAPSIQPEAPAPTPDEDLAALEAFMKTAGPSAETPPAPATPEAAAPAVPPQPQQRPPAIPPEVLTAAQMAQRIDAAAMRGDAAGILGMFDPRVVAAITDHVYRQNADAFAQRYANEANGVHEDPRVGLLQQQLAELAQGLQQRQQTEEQQRTQAMQARAQQAAQQKAQAHIDALFKTVKLEGSPHRAWIESRLLNEVSRIQNAPRNIWEGRYGDINSVFHNLYKEFRPLLQATASTAQPAPKPNGAAQLMAAPSGNVTTTASETPDPSSWKDTSGKVPEGWFKSKLKALVS